MPTQRDYIGMINSYQKAWENTSNAGRLVHREGETTQEYRGRGKALTQEAREHLDSFRRLAPRGILIAFEGHLKTLEEQIASLDAEFS